MREIHITTAELKANAKALYDRGMLTAQHPTKPLCVNLDDTGRKCAVAASYPDEVLGICPAGVIRVVQRALRGEVVAPHKVGGRSVTMALPEGAEPIALTFEDQHFATELQYAHDNWALYEHEVLRNVDEYAGYSRACRDENKAKFLAMLEA